MSDAIPYQTYRSKRNSHPHLAPTFTSRPSSIARSPSPSLSPPRTLNNERAPVPAGKAPPPFELLLASSQPEGDAGDPSPSRQSPPPSSSSSSPSSSTVTKTGAKKSTFRHVRHRSARSPLGTDNSNSPQSQHQSSLSVEGPPVPPKAVNASGPHQPSIAPAGEINQVTNSTPSGHPDVDSIDQPTPPPPVASREPSITPAPPQPPNKPQPTGPHLPSTSRVPYRPGFQPNGRYRPLTDEFITLRSLKRETGVHRGAPSRINRVEKAKLSRRLEKLIDLHFGVPDSVAEGSLNGGNKTTSSRAGSTPASHNRRASSLFDLDIKNLRISDTADLWRGVVGNSKTFDIRAAEQRITPWQDDAEVTRCPLCNTSFHPLTNRKHHCRLCGQVICSLPAKGPRRPAPCSLLFVVDSKTRIIEEVGEGVDYGVRTKPQGLKPEEEKFLKGVRICRACRPVLLRQQHQQEIHHVPVFVILYDALIGLEHEIEGALPRFHEILLGSSRNGRPTKDASATRKRLLEAFTQYDALAKRIQILPCPNGVGSSQDRVQMAVMTRASSFLQKNMFSLKSLPAPEHAKPSAKLGLSNVEEGPVLDGDSKVALLVQPLLEQEALLESFVEEANARRKFEDVQTLKANLVEIREEIDRIIVNAQSGMLDSVNA